MRKSLLGASILLFNINGYAENSTNKTIQKSFVWVAADHSDLQRTVFERLKKETRYPKEIDADDYQLTEKRREIQKKIYTLEIQGNDKCNKQFIIKSKTEAPTPRANASEDPREHYNEPNRKTYNPAHDNKELQECYANISGAKEHQTLTSQQNEISSLNQKRREFDESIRKKSEQILDAIVSAYSKENNIQLIVNSRSDAIIYNKELVTLDVTQKIKAIINSKKTFTD
ncbi:MAG TPA: hypothetical protein PK002_04540 [Cellvibrio sp.]|nr:hypothetical protein [Cellvibrio sp.]